MLPKQTRKRRKQAIKPIKMILDDDYFKEHRELKGIFREALLCYKVGAEIASHAMAVSFIERFLRNEFEEFDKNITLFRFLEEHGDEVFKNTQLNSELHELRKQRNDNLHENIIVIELLTLKDIINSTSSNAKSALKALTLAASIYKQVTQTLKTKVTQ